jgi:Carboxypeptidase regulatory-like domain/TonB dependent receptor
MKSKIVAVMMFVCCAPMVFAQESRGTIAGRITDPSSSALAGVQVRALNTQTGASASSRTNESGLFNIPYLLPGVYQVSAELAGFSKLERNGIEVRVSETVDVNLSMTVGDVTQVLNVGGDTPLLETSSVSMGQVVDQKRLVDLPIASGNAAELVLLAPGTTNATDLRSRKAAFNNGPSQVTTDGNAQYSNEFAIDGVPNTFASGSSPRIAFSPPQGALSEFKIETTSYDASLGHTPGSLVNMTTASGTNQFHGEVHEFLGNAALDAPSFFQNKSSLAKPQYEDNRFGGTIGGPVIIPKLYNGRQKTFFLYSYEGNKWGTPGTATGTVPTDAEKGGDFSALLKLGSSYQLYDPNTTVANANGTFSRQPLAGNIIPANRINPVAASIAKYWAEPNTAGTSAGSNNYAYNSTTQEDYYVHFGRLDHNISEKHRIFLRVDYDYWEEHKNNLYSNIASGIILNRINRGLAFDDVYVIGPSTIFNFRYGITDQEFPEQRQSRGISLASLGFSPGLTSLIPANQATFPTVNIAGFSGFGAVESGDGTNTSLINSFNAGLTTQVKSHSIHYGIDFRIYRAFQNRFPNDVAPAFTFNNTYTRATSTSAAAPLGAELAQFLLGIPDGNMTRSSSYADQELYFGGFIHDQWKVNRKLTLNIGLRLEHETPITERYNRAVLGFDNSTANPIAAQAVANYAAHPIPEIPVTSFKVVGGLKFVGGNNGRDLWDQQSVAWLPRFGFAYELTPKTILRGGYGLFFDTLGTNRSPAIQTGFTATTPITNSFDNGLTFSGTLANPFPNGLQSPAGSSLGLATNLGQNLSVYSPYRPQPYAQRWSFDVQRELPAGFLLDAAYVGNRGTKLPVARELNYTPAQYLSTTGVRDQTTINFLGAAFANPFYGLNSVYGTTISRANLLKPYPEFGNISETEPIGYSWYHSLQAQIVKRFSKGYTLNVAYTYSKAMEATAFLNASDPTPWAGISTLDRPHRIVVSGIWELPVGRGRYFGSNMPRLVDGAIGGWQLGAVITRQSGAPLNFGDIIFNGDIKNIVLPKDQRSTTMWFNTNAGFVKAAGDQLASDIRTFPLRFSGIRGDGQALWNFSLVKVFPIKESVRFQLRGDCYNSLNHPNLTDPNTTVTSTAFGTITAQNGSPRSFQVSAKLSF